MSRFILPRGYLSASAINTFLRCGLQFKYRYVDDIVSPPNAAMLEGSAVHTGHEYYFKDILEGCSMRMTPDMVAELAQTSLEESAKDQNFELEGEEKDIAMKEVGIATETYIAAVGQYVDPLSVEDEIRYTSRCGVDILGYLDLTRKPMSHEEELNKLAACEEDRVDAVIADYKFTGKKMDINQVKNSLQFNLYALSTGIPNFEVKNLVRTTKKVDFLPDKGNPHEPVIDKATNLRLLRHRFDGSDFDHIENLIETVASAITAGVFIPCDMGAWNCSEKWCGYWHLCRGRGQESRLIFDMAVNT